MSVVNLGLVDDPHRPTVGILLSLGRWTFLQHGSHILLRVPNPSQHPLDLIHPPIILTNNPLHQVPLLLIPPPISSPRIEFLQPDPLPPVSEHIVDSPELECVQVGPVAVQDAHQFLEFLLGELESLPGLAVDVGVEFAVLLLGHVAVEEVGAEFVLLEG